MLPAETVTSDEEPEQPGRLADALIRTAICSAEYHARRIARQSRLPGSDVEDIRQDVLVEVLHRAARFEPARAAWFTFVDMVVRQAAHEAMQRYRRVRRAEPVSLDAPLAGSPELTLGDTIAEADGLLALWGSAADPRHAIEISLDLARTIGALPVELQELCRLLARHSPLEAQRLSGLSPARFYRRLQDLRMCFRSRGLTP